MQLFPSIACFIYPACSRRNPAAKNPDLKLPPRISEKAPPTTPCATALPKIGRLAKSRAAFDDLSEQPMAHIISGKRLSKPSQERFRFTRQDARRIVRPRSDHSALRLRLNAPYLPIINHAHDNQYGACLQAALFLRHRCIDFHFH